MFDLVDKFSSNKKRLDYAQKYPPYPMMDINKLHLLQNVYTEFHHCVGMWTMDMSIEALCGST